jgi:hypothetical protein
MENPGMTRAARDDRAARRRIRAEKIETALIVALAALVLFKGLPALAGITLGIAEMMMALTRL